MAKWTIPDDAPIFGEKPKPDESGVAVAVTLGNGNEFGIDKDDDLFIGRVSEPASRIYLGPATFKNFQNLMDNLDRIKLHTKP